MSAATPKALVDSGSTESLAVMATKSSSDDYDGADLVSGQYLQLYQSTVQESAMPLGEAITKTAKWCHRLP